MTEKTAGFRWSGGPLAAKGVIMMGLTGQAAGGNLIAAFDPETGEKLWTFQHRGCAGHAGRRYLERSHGRAAPVASPSGPPAAMIMAQASAHSWSTGADL